MFWVGFFSGSFDSCSFYLAGRDEISAAGRYGHVSGPLEVCQRHNATSNMVCGVCSPDFVARHCGRSGVVCLDALVYCVVCVSALWDVALVNWCIAYSLP